jgi:mono/diheme cytochrome c family protein
LNRIVVAATLAATVSLFGCSGGDQAASSASNAAAGAASDAANAASSAANAAGAAATAAASAAGAAKDSASGTAKTAADKAGEAAGAAKEAAGHAMAAGAAAGAVAMGSYDTAHGKEIYSQNCAACHGATGEGGVGAKLAGGHRSFAKPGHAGDVAWIKNPKPPMPKLYPSPLNDKDVNDVAAYVETLK